MKELTFEYIKSQFEHKDFYYRSIFIEEYHFEDTYLEYYKNFILNYTTKTKKLVYLSDLIDLANYLSIYDITLIERYKQFLLNPHSVIVKLSCINYLLGAYEEGKINEIVDIFRLALKSTNSEVLKSDILISILSISFNQNEFDKLIFLLSEAKDWRTPTRMLRTLAGFDINIEIVRKQQLVNVMLEANAKKNYGAGFREAFNELPLDLRLDINVN